MAEVEPSPFSTASENNVRTFLLLVRRSGVRSPIPGVVARTGDRLMKTIPDAKLHALLGECLGELDASGEDARRMALELLRRVEEVSPGVIEQMAVELQLSRLPRTTAH